MTDITFITSNSTKLAHSRHLCKEYDINILQYKKFFYGKGYVEPRIYDRKTLLEESINDAIKRWKKNVSSGGKKLFFIEDTSVIIEAFSDEENEIPGVDIKYWMQEYNFKRLDEELKRKGNNRNVIVSSHIILFLSDDIKLASQSKKDFIIFSSTSNGTIVKKEQSFETQILYPWLDNKTFNKWFVPNGFDIPISMLDIADADKVDFRKGAFEQMFAFLQKYNAIQNIQRKTIIPRLNFNPLYVVCGPTCAGKSTIGKLLLEEYDYYHIEASDFMSLKYFETHGTKFTVDKNIYAAELLKINPLVIVESTINYIQSKKIFDNFIVTGFRTSDEVSSFLKHFPMQDIKLIYVDAELSIRYNRWINRQRDNIEYTFEKFVQINELQKKMGLLDIKNMVQAIQYKNNQNGLPQFLTDFSKKIISVEPTLKKVSLNNVTILQKIPLEKAIFIVLALEYKKNESIYYTTTEIAHLIDKIFIDLKKNKNNISRYFNQAFYPYYEIKKENGKNKFKLSPTGYSEAIRIIRNLQKFILTST